MVRNVLVSLAVLAAAGAASAVDIGSGPSPSPTPVSWEFEFRHDPPRRIVVQLPATPQPTVFWYMVYTVTNPGPRTQDFFPLFQLVTDDLRVIDTDMGINPLVFNAIKERHKQTHPYLVRPTEAIGELLAGDDHARESVAIWRAGELDVHHFKTFIAGLSGEATFVPNPSYDPNRPETPPLAAPTASASRIAPAGGAASGAARPPTTAPTGGTPAAAATGTTTAPAGAVGVTGTAAEGATNPRRFTLRKTLEVQYDLPGSDRARATAEPVFVLERWIMR